MAPLAPSPSPRRVRRSAEIRERLFRSALLLFAQKGFAETTVEDITEAADLGKGTFFNYFPSKDHILMAFAEMQIRKLEVFVHDVRGTRDPMPQILRALMSRMTEEPIRNPEIVRALIQANLTSAAVRREMARLHDRNRELLAEEIAQVWRQMIFGTLLFWSLIGDNSLPQRIELAIGILWTGLAPRSPGGSDSVGKSGSEVLS